MTEEALVREAIGDRDPVIIGGARTGIGRLLGSLSGFSAAELGGFAIKGALDRAGVAPEGVEYERIAPQYGVRERVEMVAPARAYYVPVAPRCVSCGY